MNGHTHGLLVDAIVGRGLKPLALCSHYEANGLAKFNGMTNKPEWHFTRDKLEELELSQLTEIYGSLLIGHL